MHTFRYEKSKISSACDIVVLAEMVSPTPHIHAALVIELKNSARPSEGKFDQHEINQLYRKVFSFMHNQLVLYGLLLNTSSASIYKFTKVFG